MCIYARGSICACIPNYSSYAATVVPTREVVFFLIFSIISSCPVGWAVWNMKAVP
jgi:hypothetical protein